VTQLDENNLFYPLVIEPFAYSGHLTRNISKYDLFPRESSFRVSDVLSNTQQSLIASILSMYNYVCSLIAQRFDPHGSNHENEPGSSDANAWII